MPNTHDTFTSTGVGRGLVADRPAADTNNQNFFWFATDEGKLYVSSGEAWVETVNADGLADVQADLDTAEADIATLQTDLGTAEGNITTLQTDLDTAEADIVTAQGDITTVEGDLTTHAAKTQTVRATTGSISGLGSADVTINWPVAWADTSYTAVAALLENANTGVRIVRVKTLSTTQAVIRVTNDSASDQTGTIHLIGVHD